MFSRLIQDCCGVCEDVTPLMLSSPYYKGRYSGIIIPAGFGNPAYSKLLPALRVSKGRFARYIENGGRVLVFSSAAVGPNKYDWLPVFVEFHSEYGEHRLLVNDSSPWKTLYENFDPECFVSDGWFEVSKGEIVAEIEDGKPVCVQINYGKGVILLAISHEYPTRSFLQTFQQGGCDVVF